MWLRLWWCWLIHKKFKKECLQWGMKVNWVVCRNFWGWLIFWAGFLICCWKCLWRKSAKLKKKKMIMILFQKMLFQIHRFWYGNWLVRGQAIPSILSQKLPQNLSKVSKNKTKRKTQKKGGGLSLEHLSPKLKKDKNSSRSRWSEPNSKTVNNYLGKWTLSVSLSMVQHAMKPNSMKEEEDSPLGVPSLFSNQCR